MSESNESMERSYKISDIGESEGKEKETTKIDANTLNEIYPHKMWTTLFDLILLIGMKEKKLFDQIEKFCPYILMIEHWDEKRQNAFSIHFICSCCCSLKNS